MGNGTWDMGHGIWDAGLLNIGLGDLCTCGREDLRLSDVGLGDVEDRDNMGIWECRDTVTWGHGM